MTDREPWLAHTVAEMTVAEKVGQMTQASHESITPSEVAAHHIG